VNLIVSASLSEPPTEPLCFRHVTYLANKHLSLDCLLEVEQELKDAYYKFLLKQGLMENIADIITPQEHFIGVRLTDADGLPPIISVNSITNENFREIIALINAAVNPKWSS
jgi:hypothetical protein